MQDFPAYSEIAGMLTERGADKLPRLNVSVLSNIVVESLDAYLQYLACEIGFQAVVQFGQYDHVFQESVGGSPELLNESTDCVLVFPYLEALSPLLTTRFASASESDIRQEITRLREYVKAVANGIRKQTGASVIWHSFEMPSYPALGIFDWQTDRGQSQVIGDLNRHVRDILRGVPGCYLLDMNACLARVGQAAFYDPRYWHMARAPYSRAALRQVALQDFVFVRSMKGKNKKCLVLDCDNTLWGGIIGEDGLAGIKLAEVYPGSPYQEFQQEILNLYHRGVILALCSKNNESDVWEAFDRHPGMVLKREHIAAAQINWEDKAVNLRQIASDLNIGLDSLVFVDDSDFEVNLVRQMLPAVDVIHLPKDRAIEFRSLLAGCGLFDSLSLSAEDRQRGAMYKMEASRRKLRSQTTSLAEYLRSLEMVLRIDFATPLTVPRVAQQTQRTNQFNLTTRRYSEAEISRFVQSDSADVLTVQLSDRLGDLGIIGVCILCYDGPVATVDTLLLSCRALGRGVEEVFLRHVLVCAQRHGCSHVAGRYIRTPKNAQVEDFYPRNGFAERPAQGGEEERVFDYQFAGVVSLDAGPFKEVHSTMEAR